MGEAMTGKEEAEMSAGGGTGLVIGIPTFRRPQSLQALLDSLLGELAEHPATVVIADNDCGSEAPALVAAFRARWPRSRCIPVAARGVAQVRNALVAEAHRVCPDWQWLVMLDDDGLATSGWLAALLAAGTRYEADLVGGPVQGVLPDGAGRLARNSVFAARRRWQTGLVPLLNTTQNLAISRRALRLAPEPLFRNEYGASGGEDYDLFRRVARAGGRLVWCDDAVVLEPAPADRLTVRGLLHRYASTGMYMVVIDRAYDGVGQVWLGAVKGLLRAGGATALATLLLRRDRAACGLLDISHYVGRLAGLLGWSSARYVPAAVKDSQT
jgi:glycosyltransferase involved in cell wall biosynthesis